jgi:hypothetical protein
MASSSGSKGPKIGAGNGTADAGKSPKPINTASCFSSWKGRTEETKKIMEELKRDKRVEHERNNNLKKKAMDEIRKIQEKAAAKVATQQPKKTVDELMKKAQEKEYSQESHQAMMAMELGMRYGFTDDCKYKRKKGPAGNGGA